MPVLCSEMKSVKVVLDNTCARLKIHTGWWRQSLYIILGKALCENGRSASYPSWLMHYWVRVVRGITEKVEVANKIHIETSSVVCL